MFWVCWLDVKVLCGMDEKKAQVVLKFEKDRTGFKNAREFEKSFEADDHSKKERNIRASSPGSAKYGWFPSEEHYKAEGAVGAYLRQNGENEDLEELQTEYNLRTFNLSRINEEKDSLHQSFYQETTNMQQTAREKVKRVLDEQEKLHVELENTERHLNSWSRELNKREALTESDRQQLENDVMNSSLMMASEEQKKADECVLRIVEEHKREKEAALKNILDLERDLDAKQKLEMEIAKLKGKLEVMNYLGDDATVQKKIKELNEELEEKNKIVITNAI
ncbi:endoribonuclease [Lithospermum erythrorhizon]|uniref:Endoribonuclease n=1 Tax=Lithospermum erythrorhizon TaxID=34254 RepID=A0AAV3RL42_LITER